MAYRIRRVCYFHTTVIDQPGEAYKLLHLLANLGINLVAFTAVPLGRSNTQLTIFPDDVEMMKASAGDAGLQLDGPHRALLVQGDDQLGAFAAVHEKLADAGVNVYASSGVADGRGSYGYVLYVRPEDYERAGQALRI